MKQIIQDLKSGETILEEVPVPQIRKGHVLIKTHRSLVSLGTERMLVEFGKSNLISKARQQPEKVKQVFDKIKSDGLMPTLEAVFLKLEEPLPLGYCSAGEVIEVGEGVTEFQVGDRVSSNGQHAEYVCIPKNLVAKIPDNISYDEAAFTVIGSIGLQGIRLINPTLGETVVVSGLGLIGLLASQMLRANGCNVIGFDFDQSKVDLAKSLGVKAFNLADGTDPAKLIEGLTDGVGVDAVLITASTKSNDVISQSARMCRKRGRIVLVGVIGLDIQRSDFYEKELSFQVSCSYGPGRYDSEYEQKGIDYPLPYVRWTEKRNFQTILNAISDKTLNVQPLITEVIDLENYNSIYGGIGKSRSIASLLKYKEQSAISSSVKVSEKNFSGNHDVIGIIGSGNFTKMTMLPMLKKLNANLKYIASAGGVSGTFLAKKYGISHTTTRYEDMLSDADVKAVMITTRHNQHAEMCLQALNAGKHVFVEKPLALNNDELRQIIDAHEKNGGTVTVGFNRRFSPFSIKAKQLLGTSNEPMQVIATMNAGFIPPNLWYQDMKTGGGRIIGEACHFIDLITFFTGSLVESVVLSAMGTNPQENTDNAAIILKYKNGSQGVINYFSNGNKTYSKERIEIYSQGKNIIVDNFRSMKCYGYSFSGMSKSQDKGHREQFNQYITSLKQGGKPIISFAEVVNATQASFAAIESLKTGGWVKV